MASDDNQDPYSVIGDRTTGWFDRRARSLANSRHPVLKVCGWIAVIVVACIAISIVSGVINFGSSYVQAGKQIISVQNVKAQRTALIGDWQALLNATGNACDAINSKQNSNSPTLVEDPAFAYAATVRNIRADYNRRQHNLFEAEVVGPPGYPRTVPDQALMDSPHPPWCKINQDLVSVHD